MKTGKWFRRLIAMLLVSALMLGSTAMADWQKDGGGWWYSYSDGSYARNKWIQDGSSWYFCGNDGYMVTGWQNIAGTMYYFDQNGKMAVGWKSIGQNWYHFNKDGGMDKGWLSDGGNWYYLDNTGAMATGWVQSGKSWYYLKADGSMAKGWQKIDGSWYYLDSNGAMATGWREINGKWFCFDGSGKMHANTYIDQKYFVDENGQWDGIVRSSIPDADVPAGDDEQAESDTIEFTFIMKGWYIARLEVQVWDKQAQKYIWMYSESRAKGQTAKMKIDTTKYEVNRVGYQIWFFGWDNDYMNLPWANTNYAKTFILSGSGDYPEFTWE